MTIGRVKRDPRDVYETPAWAIGLIMPRVLKLVPPGRSVRVLDPCAGNGAISEQLAVAYGRRNVRLLDIAAGEDYLHERDRPLVDLVMMNPPYSQAEAFVQRALDGVRLTKYPADGGGVGTSHGYVVALLRLAFLEGQKRAAWMAKAMPIEAHVLTRRPSFTGGGTDSAAYAWFIWRRGYRGKTTRVRLLR